MSVKNLSIILDRHSSTIKITMKDNSSIYYQIRLPGHRYIYEKSSYFKIHLGLEFISLPSTRIGVNCITFTLYPIANFYAYLLAYHFKE